MGDAGGDEQGVVAGDEVVGFVDVVELEAGVGAAFALVVVAWGRAGSG